ncbi:MAG: bifunctional pyr operon transcriptional regulator/uracil phosphoribosyltransferase PyrR [Firmicutes bacterium]|nr:bifunctional pyr operon transcriptional regulator/uracil phosphoribosyltransferase PyrR [Bacillota bacterium]MBR6014605.1 bifunctional pyr operon transcriptional regulator/uracil phosphoribosyltransferase PyrR [Bacillota bacterium]
MLKLKSQVMHEDEVERALKRMAHQITEKNEGCDNVVLLGIKSRGVPLAEKLAAYIKLFEGVDVPVGKLDITRHRDDLTESEKPEFHGSEISFEVAGRDVILVDDVIYTGRTVRAAMDAVTEFGRAGTIQLCVLIDRGFRELPIRPDYVGKNIPTSRREKVVVTIAPLDKETGVSIYEKEGEQNE